MCQAASSNWFHRMTLLSGGAYLLNPGAALDQVYNKEKNTMMILDDFGLFFDNMGEIFDRFVKIKNPFVIL